MVEINTLTIKQQQKINNCDSEILFCNKDMSRYSIFCYEFHCQGFISVTDQLIQCTNQNCNCNSFF